MLYYDECNTHQKRRTIEQPLKLEVSRQLHNQNVKMLSKRMYSSYSFKVTAQNSFQMGNISTTMAEVTKKYLSNYHTFIMQQHGKVH